MALDTKTNVQWGSIVVKVVLIGRRTAETKAEPVAMAICLINRSLSACKLKTHTHTRIPAAYLGLLFLYGASVVTDVVVEVFRGHWSLLHQDQLLVQIVPVQ